MLDIKGTNVTVMVSNMDTATNFYTETLGFTLKNRYGDHWADIEGPGIVIGLHPSGKDVKTGDNLSIALRVNDLDKAVAILKQRGVQFKQHDDKEVKLVFFTDPDNNTLYLVNQ